MWIFRPSRLHRKSKGKQNDFFDHQNCIEKSTWKQRGFLDHRNYTWKNRWKQRGFFDHWNTSKKVRGSNRNFLTIKTSSKKVRGNNVDFSTFEITSKKYVRIDVDVECLLGHLLICTMLIHLCLHFFLPLFFLVCWIQYVVFTLVIEWILMGDVFFIVLIPRSVL